MDLTFVNLLQIIFHHTLYIQEIQETDLVLLFVEYVIIQIRDYNRANQRAFCFEMVDTNNPASLSQTGQFTTVKVRHSNRSRRGQKKLWLFMESSLLLEQYSTRTHRNQAFIDLPSLSVFVQLRW